MAGSVELVHEYDGQVVAELTQKFRTPLTDQNDATSCFDGDCFYGQTLTDFELRSVATARGVFVEWIGITKIKLSDDLSS